MGIKLTLATFVLMGIFAELSLADGPHRRSRYYRRGGNYQTENGNGRGTRYYAQDQFQGTHQSNSSEYSNRWNVGSDYAVDHNGNVYAHGALGTTGAETRVYRHGGTQEEKAALDRREDQVQQIHRNYVNQTENNYQNLAEVHAIRAELLARPQRQKSEDLTLQRQNSFINIYRHLGETQRSQRDMQIRQLE